MRYREFYSYLFESIDDSEKEPYEIKGEYWIQDGSIQFADGDVGDYNHESIVMHTAKGDVFNYLDINVDPESGDFEPLVEQALKREGMEIPENYDLEEVFYEYIKENFSESEADKARGLYRAATDRTDLRMFAKKNWGWIWLRGNDVGLYELTPKTIKHLIDGIENVLSDSGDDEVTDDQIDLSIGVDKTGKHYYVTLEELKDGKLGSSGTKADAVKKSDVINSLDKSIQHPFYKDRMDENNFNSKNVLYNGTNISDIDEFIGGWWTPNKKVAREFGPKVYKSEVTIDNPAYEEDLRRIYKELTGEQYSDEDRDYELADWFVERKKDELIKRGYDGIVIYDETNIESDFAYVPFNSGQIKIIR